MDLDRGRTLLGAHLLPGETLCEVIPWTFPNTGQSIVVGVAVTAERARRFEVDDQGRLTSLESLMDLEATARRVRLGTMNEALQILQRDLADGDPVDFTVYVAANTTPPSLPFDGTDQAVPVEALNAHIRAHRDLVAWELREAKEALVTWLEHEGSTVEDLAALPIIKVRATARVLRDARLREADVLGLDVANTGESELLGYAGHASMRESSLTGGLCGGRCDGGGLSVGIWELDSANLPTIGAVATNNYRLGTAATETYQQAPTTCAIDTDCTWDPFTFLPFKCKGGRCVGEHLSIVAGMIGMNDDYTYPAGDPALQGITFPPIGTSNVVQFVGNTTGVEGMNWLRDMTAASSVNRSMSNFDVTSPYATNWVARYDVIFTTVAAGNDGLQSGTVKNEAFFNALMVGAYRYETWDSPSTHRRAALSSFINDTLEYPGQERPHILGPGAHTNGFVSTAGLNIPDIAGDATGQMKTASYALDQGVPVEAVGSSFAAPAVLSVAIQAYQYEGFFSYLYYPVMRKAVLLASAVDANADGEVGKGTEWASTPDSEDGAGRPDLYHLKQLLDANRYAYIELTDAMFVSCGTNCRKYSLGNLSVGAGRSLKAALVWNACPLPNDRSFSAADLDLVIVRPGWCGGTLRQSVSVGNEVEMIYDNCLASSKLSGTYTAEVRIKNGGSLPTTCGSTEPIAFAWSTR